MRIYRMLADSSTHDDVKKGMIVYGTSKYDYGLAYDDTRFFGMPHISLSRRPDGDYPLFTAPEMIIEEISDVDYSKTS